MTTLKALCSRIRIESQYGGVEVPDGFAPGTHPYRVTLTYRRHRLTVPFFMGPALCEEPTADGVLDCLLSDASAGEQTFEEFCSDFGYDSDSRKAEATYRACAAMAPRLRRFLGDDFEAFQRAER
jgi:hypothetical protein